MNLNAPKKNVWLIAVIVGVLGIVGHLVPAIPIPSTYAFWLVVGGFGLLTLSTALKSM